MRGKRILASVLAVCICITGVLTLTPVTVDAKGSPKLSSKSVLLAAGGKQTITLKNGSGKWSVKDDSIAKIAKKTGKSVVIKPVKAGTTYVYCKAGKKKLSCKVKVVNERIGDPLTDLGYAAVVGDTNGIDYTLREGEEILSMTYDKKKGKVVKNTSKATEDGGTAGSIVFKALKPGRFTFTIETKNTGKNVFTFAFINGFRGKASVKKTDANYRKWRKKTLNSLVSKDMSTWEIIDAVGTLISTGKYSNKGGATGEQLWYGGNGTCVSGAMMMDDFLKDLGIKSKVHFVGTTFAEDIFGYQTMTAAEHRNTWITLGKGKYILNPQPGIPWPYGTIKR